VKPSGAHLSAEWRRGGALHGFSLIELIAVLRYYLTTMVKDLRNLGTTEAAYWNITGTYSTDLRVIRYSNSPRVSISMVSADTLGWAAKANYAGDSATCAIYYGNAPVLAPATLKDVIGCTQ
jgi:hypothetical protein